MTMKIYYAHPMSWYGTQGEKLDIAFLSRSGEVINPNTPPFHDLVDYAKAHDRAVMTIFADVIRKDADAVAFRRFDDGKLGAGVGREIYEAVIWNKFLFEIKTVGFSLSLDEVDASALDFGSILTVEQTRRRIARGEL